MRTGIRCVLLCGAALGALGSGVIAQDKVGYEYRVLATSKTSTMENEMNAAAEGGFRFRSVMGGDTAIGGSEVVAVMVRSPEIKGRYAYKLLATSKTSTMEKELQQAADAGFEYADQTVFKSASCGEEVVCILERNTDTRARSQYRLIATT